MPELRSSRHLDDFTLLRYSASDLDDIDRMAREALEQHKQLNEIDLSAYSEFFSELPADYLTPENIVNRKSHSPSLP